MHGSLTFRDTLASKTEWLTQSKNLDKSMDRSLKFEVRSSNGISSPFQTYHFSIQTPSGLLDQSISDIGNAEISERAINAKEESLRDGLASSGTRLVSAIE